MGQTMLVRVTGRDRPGITAGILHILATSDASVLDMEQVVIHDRLNLGLLVRFESPDPPLKELLFFAWERDVTVDFEVVGEPADEPAPPRFAVTVIGQELTPDALAGVADGVVSGGGNIDRITRLSRYPVVSYELVVVGGAMDRLRSELLLASAEHRVDIAVQREGLSRRAKRLVVIDMDSTLIRDEVIDLLAEEADSAGEVRRITEEAMAGTIDFETALRTRVATLAGLDGAALERVAARVRLTPGARTFARTLRRLGYRTAIVSGGFDVFAERTRRLLGMDLAFANRLETEDGILTGRLEGPVLDGAGKARVLVQVAADEDVPLEQTVAIGDGGNDLDMLSIAGLGIAFNAKPVVDAAADTTLKVPYLDAILFLLGIRREEIEEVDLADGLPTRGGDST